MIFSFTALDKNGKSVSDIIDAISIEKARLQLKKNGLYITSISEQSIKKKIDISKRTNNQFFYTIFSNIINYFASKRIKKEVGLFSRQLSTLIGAGMPLLRAISDIVDQTESKRFKIAISDIKEKVESGSSFSNALSKHNNLFSEMYINMVRVGENLGSLDEVVERLAEIEETMAKAGFWDHQQSAQSTISQLSSLKSMVEPIEDALRSAEELAEFLELAEVESDRQILKQIEDDLYLFPSKYLLYILSSILAQSQLSVPPAPAWIEK